MTSLSLSGVSRASYLAASIAKWRVVRPSWSLPCIASGSTSTSVPSRTLLGATPAAEDHRLDTSSLERPSAPWKLALIPLIDSIAELFPPILLAVPKHKVTHSRKSMRSANKGLKNKTNFSHCEGCGMIKLAHNVCPNCYSQISRRWKQEARGEGAGAASVADGTAQQSL